MVNKPIMIVDDEAIVRESIGDWLKDAGYQVATVKSGEEALEMMEKQDFSVVILDIRLPGMTGMQVLREVKTKRPEIKSIIITAYPTVATATEAKKFAAVDYLIKLAPPDDLEKLIGETLLEIEKSK